jgi:predicted DNA-binding transcriptional regulator AlpA
MFCQAICTKRQAQDSRGANALNESNTIENLLREKDVAKILNVSVQKVRTMRFDGSGPAVVKIGKSIRYKPSDVRSFLDSFSSVKKVPEKKPILLADIFNEVN